MKTPVLLAVLGGAHGLKGEVRAQAFTDDPLALGAYGPLFDAAGRRFDVLSTKPAKTVVLVKFKDIDDRTAAEALNGVELFVDRSALPEDDLDDAEFYQADLIGLDVVDAADARHGTVIAVHDFGAGIVLELQGDTGRSVMIPFSEHAVRDVDLSAGRMTVDPLAAGLIDDGDEGERDGAADAPQGAPAQRPERRSGSRRRRPHAGRAGD
jgi:16S rRNA processing protein RimM